MMDCETPDLTIYEPEAGAALQSGAAATTRANCPFCREDKTLRNPDGTVMKFITMYTEEEQS